MTGNASRRKFVGGMAAFAAGGALPDLARGDEPGSARGDDLSSASNAAPASAPVLVIGAGMAGLTVARELRRMNLPVVVIEGRDRLGGRILTWRGLSAPVDLGASWIHGATGNPVTDLASEFGVRTVQTDVMRNSTHDPDGRALTPQEFFEFGAASARMRAGLRAQAGSLTADRTLTEGIDIFLRGETLEPALRARLNLFIAGFEAEFASDLSDVSMLHHDAFEAFGGKDRLFPDGYEQIIRGLSEGIEIRTGRTVRRIEHGPEGVRVITDEGEFAGRAVVVTVPLGVLKDEAIEFSPPLPDPKRRAISNLHMGVLNKVVLEFPRVFWPENPDFIFSVPDAPDSFPNFVNYARLAGKPILVALIGGGFGRRMEDMDDEEIVRLAMKRLRANHGADAPDPVAFTITRWGREPFSLGSYSHIPPGASPDDHDALAAPVGDRLFFAGEATSRDYHSTVHGAHLSGLREARRFTAM